MSQTDRTPSSGSQRQHPRTRRRRAAHPAMSALVYALFVIAVSVILACVTWVAANDVLALNKEPITATIVVEDVTPSAKWPAN